MATMLGHALSAKLLLAKTGVRFMESRANLAHYLKIGTTQRKTLTI
jgi:hypothetical protein